MRIVLNMQLKSHRESVLYKVPMDEIEKILDNNVAIMQLSVISDMGRLKIKLHKSENHEDSEI